MSVANVAHRFARMSRCDPPGAFMNAAATTSGVSTEPGVFALLGRLDDVLRQAVAQARTRHAESGADGSFRGIYISEQDVDQTLSLDPGGSILGPGLAQAALGYFKALPQIAQISRDFALDAFDHAVLLLALAPELDLRYERIYAYLQDDVTRRKPTVDLALQLLTASAPERLSARRRFTRDAGLLRSGLLQLVPDQGQVEPPLIAHYLRLDERAVRALLDDDALDPRLAAFCTRTAHAPKRAELGAAGDLPRRLPHFVVSARAASRPVRLVFAGPTSDAKCTAARALASAEGAALLAVDLERYPKWRNEPAELAELVLREASLCGALIYIVGLTLDLSDAPAARILVDALSSYTGVVILGAESPPPGASSERYLSVEFTLPDLAEREAAWQRSAQSAGLSPSAGMLAGLAQQFVLAPEQIAAAVAAARQNLEWLVTGTGTLSPGDVEQTLLAAARAQTRADLGGLTAKHGSAYRFKDLVLPAEAIAQLQEICTRVAQAQRVLEGTTNPHFARARGVTVLFAGPSGTGKTMAAEVIANELGLDLFRIDLSTVTSKYIGETQKNLERIFQAAVRSNSVLLFDEADALFGKRSEVRDAHDRYANLEVSYLLQRMEQYDGVTVLTTNLRSNLDEAFQRRIVFTVNFGFPEESERLRLWRQVWPAEVTLDPRLDLAALAKRFRLSGGNIRNIALGALFRAADHGNGVRLEDVLHALRREYEKVGRVMSPAELALGAA